MAGGHVKYRHLSRDSAHRKALLRNLVTSLFEHESIQTTWPKAKEAQRLAEKLVTLGKRDTSASRRRAHEIFFRPLELVPKLFSTIKDRYADRAGGYTRVLRTDNIRPDKAPTAILELVDGPRDMRFAITAQTIARDRALERAHSHITLLNKSKILKFRKEEELEEMVMQFLKMESIGEHGERDAYPSIEQYDNSFGPRRSEQHHYLGPHSSAQRKQTSRSDPDYQ